MTKGGGGDDPLISTKVHVPYATGMEVAPSPVSTGGMRGCLRGIPPKHKTSPLLTLPMTQPNNCETPKH